MPDFQPSTDPDAAPSIGGLPDIDPPDPADPNLDMDQVLYHMALGAQPQDFHPALQPLARGFAAAIQPQGPPGPGLLGSADQSTPPRPDDGLELANPAPAAPLVLDTSAPNLSYTPTGSSAPQDRRAAFFLSAAPAAIASQKASGVPASVTLAQAALESGDGTRHIGDANNYFGIKAQTAKDGSIKFGPIALGYTMRPTREFKNGKYVTEIAPFRSYNSMDDSFADHARFLSTQPRYAPALDSYRSDPDSAAFARALQSSGYASDPNYADSLIDIINKYDLTQYDQ